MFAEAKLPPPYVFQGGSRSPYTAMASPSPQPSVSPHSVGRTPSPMEYAGSVPHSYQGMLGSVTYNMPARHTDFMSAGKVTRNMPVDTPAGSGLGHVIHGASDLSSVAGGGITLFDNSSGMSTIAHNGMYPGLGVFPGMANGLNPGVCIVSGPGAGASGMMAMNHVGLGIAQGAGSGGSVSVNLTPGLGLSGINVPVTSNVVLSQNVGQAMTDSNILDLDNQPHFSLDSGDLVSMGLIAPDLSENLSNSLTLSENKQQPHQAKDVDLTENMTDSFTSLTKEISTLNDMCKGSGVRDHHLT